ncbi:MAG: hypothetical protein WCI04_06050 [archaeon]
MAKKCFVCDNAFLGCGKMEYGKENYFCPKCYGAKMVTVRLRQEGSEYYCTQNALHVFTIDANGFPRSVK